MLYFADLPHIQAMSYFASLKTPAVNGKYSKFKNDDHSEFLNALFLDKTLRHFRS